MLNIKGKTEWLLIRYDLFIIIEIKIVISIQFVVGKNDNSSRFDPIRLVHHY